MLSAPLHLMHTTYRESAGTRYNCLVLRNLCASSSEGISLEGAFFDVRPAIRVLA
jgi:hypothetical protein